MNLKSELQTMSITDLRSICRDLGVSCPKTKSGIIKRLLLPLKKEYKIDRIPRRPGLLIGEFVGRNTEQHRHLENINETFMKAVMKGDTKNVDLIGQFADPNGKILPSKFGRPHYTGWRPPLVTFPIVESAKKGDVNMVDHLLKNYNIDLYTTKYKFEPDSMLRSSSKEYTGDYIINDLNNKISSYPSNTQNENFKMIKTLIQENTWGKRREKMRKKRKIDDLNRIIKEMDPEWKYHQ